MTAVVMDKKQSVMTGKVFESVIQLLSYIFIAQNSSSGRPCKLNKCHATSADLKETPSADQSAASLTALGHRASAPFKQPQLASQVSL